MLAGTITGRVWFDTNGNGQQDGAELTNASVRMTLLRSGNTIAQADTVNGIYTLSNIPAGSGYYVEFNLPDGYTMGPTDAGNGALDNDFNAATFGAVKAQCPSGYITVNDGQTQDYDAGLTLGATLTVFNWNDVNRNGLQDGGATEQNGLPSGNNDLRPVPGSSYGFASLVTGANGVGSFTNVRPGTFNLVASKFGWTPTIANAGADALDSDINDAGNSPQFTLAPGEVRTNIDAGFFDQSLATGAITGRAWLDNGDGIRHTTETNLTGDYSYDLYRSPDATVGNADDQYVTTRITDANHTYQFSGLAPGNYYVRAQPATGFLLTLLRQGGNPAVDSDFHPTSSFTRMLTVTAGATVANIDAGYVPGSARVGNLVWNDLDADGVKDTNEPGLANAVVRLYSASNLLVGAPVTTTSSGLYSFTGLTPGNYYLQISPPLGYLASPKDQAADSVDSDIDPATFRTIAFAVIAGQTHNQWDAGFYLGATIGNRVFRDKVPKNGLQDASEVGLAGAAVRLYNANSQPLATTTSDVNGAYSFVGVPTGQYFLHVTPPSGYLVTTCDVNNNTSDQTDNDFDPLTNTTVVFNVTRGLTYNQWDAGLYLGAQVGDKVWLDSDRDGRQQGNDPGKQSVVVRLKTLGPDNIAGNADDVQVKQTSTNANGVYKFLGVADGAYYVEFVRPSGYVFTQRNVGDDLGDSDAGLNNGRTAVFTIVNSANNLTLDAGLVAAATVVTHVGRDDDDDGVLDPGDPGIPGVVITIIDPGNGVVGDNDDRVLRRGATNNGGNIPLDNLPSGKLAVRVDLPAGYRFSPPGQGTDLTRDSDIYHLCDGYGYSFSFTVAAAASVGLSVGLVPLKGAVEGTVWNDRNRNQVRDGGLIKGANPDLVLAIDVSGSTTSRMACPPPADHSMMKWPHC